MLTHQRDAVVKERSRMKAAYANLKLRYMKLQAGDDKEIPIDDILTDEDKLMSDTDRVETPPYTINTWEEFPLLPNPCPATANRKLKLQERQVKSESSST